MFDKVTFEEEVGNFTGGASLTVQVCSRDGLVCIGLSRNDDHESDLKCALNADEAKTVVRALNEALGR